MLQYLLVAVVVALATGYLGWRAYRTWKGGCGSGCASKGCAPTRAAAPLIAAEDLVKRARCGKQGD